MTELLTAAQMRAIEGAAIATGAASGLDLMERAGRGVVAAILAWRPDLATAPHRAMILCGPGNNGGDGFVVARLLKERGWAVDLFLCGDDAKLPPDAAENARRWRELGAIRRAGEVRSAGELRALRPTLLIDALFGTGLRREVPPALGPFLDLSGCSGPDEAFLGVVAIDVPSGVCADSGRVLGRAMAAELTVSFHAPKIGHYLDEADVARRGGAVLSGRVVVADIGLDPRRRGTASDGAGSTVHLVSAPAVAALGKASAAHKYGHGHALVLSGGPGRGGAARLAARGALRIGCGLVTVGAPPEAIPEHAARLDAIMLRPVVGAEGLSALLGDDRLNAICLGPGLGVGETTRDMVSAALAVRRPTVLDADALTSFAEKPAELFGRLHEDSVLTPHLGEFARIFPDLAAKLREPARIGPAFSKIDALRQAASRAGCTVVLKGADTVIASPEGRVAVNSAHGARAAPWLATAGSGDVLAGFVTGLLARGFAPMRATEAAVWLHVDCAREVGPGLIAEDLPEQLPAVFRALGL